MREELKAIYDENIQWLNFAELKNGALLTMMLALLGIITQIEMSIYITTFFAVFSIVIACICILSFVPFSNRLKFLSNYIKEEYAKKNTGSLNSKNIIFYVEIFVDGKDRYKEALIKVLNQNSNYPFSLLEENYIEQILQISTIASIKYYLFKKAVMFLMIMLMIAFACAIGCLIVA